MRKAERESEALAIIFQKIRDRDPLGNAIKKFRERCDGIIDPAQEHKKISEHPGRYFSLLPVNKNENRHQKSQYQSAAEYARQENNGDAESGEFEPEQKYRR